MTQSALQPVASPYLVPFDGGLRLAEAPTEPPPGARDRDADVAALKSARREIRDLQRALYADDRYALLLVFQAMDAAGKDGTIRHVLRGVNPAGCQVVSFKQPSKEELDHDFLWRVARRTPERGRIGVFNRSHYEEVLIVRVHPSILASQRLPETVDGDAIWERRFDAIRSFERHLHDAGTVIVKFFLHLSKREQAERFLKRIDEPEKNWKFSPGDVRERGHWEAYQHAYQEALRATSRPEAPWYCVPADDKRFLRRTVAEIVRDRLASLPLRYPVLPDDERAEMLRLREGLAVEAAG